MAKDNKNQKPKAKINCGQLLFGAIAILVIVTMVLGAVVNQ
jgi:hypothetical protein